MAMMRFDVVTLFPEIFRSITDSGITARAMQRGLWSLNTWNPRDVTEDVHRTVDDRPFGGGPGMVMLAEPLARTVDAIRSMGNTGPVISFRPNGTRLNDATVRRLNASAQGYVLICGRYEGIDERFLQTYVDEVFSLGDFVLSGGELPACCLMDAMVRQLPGRIKRLSTTDESFATGLLDAPHYTRPEVWRGQAVPDVLLSGHHANIERWTREQSLALTARTRPDVLRERHAAGLLTRKDLAFLKSEDLLGVLQ